MKPEELKSLSQDELNKKFKESTRVFYLVLGLLGFALGFAAYNLLTKGSFDPKAPLLTCSIIFAYLGYHFWGNIKKVKAEMDSRGS